VGQEKEAIMGLWECIVVVVVIGCTTKIVSRWLKTKEGVTQRHVQALEQRLQVLETDVHKRLGVRRKSSSRKTSNCKESFALRWVRTRLQRHRIQKINQNNKNKLPVS